MERIVSKLALLSLFSAVLYMILGFKSALLFSSLVAIIILICGFFTSILAISKVGSQVSAKVSVNFYEVITLIISIALPFGILILITI